jgi:RNAse (barnase) inhibitor barstar
MSIDKITSAQALAWARAHGAVPHLVDGETVRSKADALDAIGAALDFPAYYGRNLDALFDCLTDLSWLPEGEHVLVWSHHQTLAQHDWQGYHQVRKALEDGAANGGTRRLKIVYTAS